MERLLYSSSPTPLKPHLKRPLIDQLKLHFPSLTRSQFAGLSSFSCRSENLLLSSSALDSSDSLLSLTDSRDGSSPNPHFIQRIEVPPAAERKAKTARTLMALCVAVLILIQPVFAPSAFASFSSAAITGGSAGPPALISY